MSDAHRVAALALAAVSPPIRAIREQVGDPVFRLRERSAFEALARSIVYQQLAGAAAHTIWMRLLTVAAGPLSPRRLDGCSDEQLKACGLSAAKLRALRDLSRQAPTLKLSSIHRAPDEVVVERLIQVRGIGRWTAEMFLIFHLRRLDVWPAGDLGVSEGYRRAFALAARPNDKQLLPLGEPFRPYRSVAAWYLWRAVEVLPATGRTE